MKIPARERLIESTAELLQVQGYRNTGLNQIIESSSTPKGSLYYYFPSGKDELVIAALEWSAQKVSTDLVRLCASQTSLSAALFAVVEHFATQLEESGFQKGCPVATVTLEQAGLNPPIQQACARAYASWHNALAQFLVQHGLASEAQVLASQLLSLIEGALLLSRAQLSTEPLYALKPLLALLLQSIGTNRV